MMCGQSFGGALLPNFLCIYIYVCVCVWAVSVIMWRTLRLRKQRSHLYERGSLWKTPPTNTHSFNLNIYIAQAQTHTHTACTHYMHICALGVMDKHKLKSQSWRQHTHMQTHTQTHTHTHTHTRSNQALIHQGRRRSNRLNKLSRAEQFDQSSDIKCITVSEGLTPSSDVEYIHIYIYIKAGHSHNTSVPGCMKVSLVKIFPRDVDLRGEIPQDVSENVSL